MADISKTLLVSNIVNMDKGKQRAMSDKAQQFITIGILARLGFRVFIADGRGGPYDLIIPAYENFDAHPEKTVLLRAQTKTMANALRFIAGTRAGVNRIYISGVKTYKYSEKDNELIIGVDERSLDLYLVPTRHIAKWGSSKSKTKLQPYKNNWDILLHWNDAFLKQLETLTTGEEVNS